jgi:hypothetical protein
MKGRSNVSDGDPDVRGRNAPESKHPEARLCRAGVAGLIGGSS